MSQDRSSQYRSSHVSLSQDRSSQDRSGQVPSGQVNLRMEFDSGVGQTCFCLIFSWHQNLAQLKSRVWHFKPSLFNTYGWVKMCLVSSCLDTGHVRTEYFLTKTFRSKFFQFQNILGEQKIHRPKFWGFKNILESKFFGPDFFSLIFSWHQNLAKLKSRVWHFQPSLFTQTITSKLKF